mgnify:CR=1 FL=1
MLAFLKKIPPFANLSAADLERLCEMVEEVRLMPGEVLFTEGSAGDHAFVIKEGEVEIIKLSGGREVLLAVRRAGEVIGEMSLLESAPRFATVKARKGSFLLSISHAELEELINSSPSAARSLLFTITSRLRSTEMMLRQSEKMAQLGTLTAGIAHELNNPAAAAQRGSTQLAEAMNALQKEQVELIRMDISPEVWTRLISEIEEIRKRAVNLPDIDPLERSDRQNDIEQWLQQQEFNNSWELAPALVDSGFDRAKLEQLLANVPKEQLSVAISWLVASFMVYSLLAEIHEGTKRISEIVKSLKVYVYLDQAPIQEVDIHEGLENTLLILRNKLKQGITVNREYSSTLPRIQAYGSELNQVWTNLIDNAIDAMEGKGELVIRTAHQGEWVLIEFEDTGPGIPEEIIDKIFSPFFTTKPVGKGTGLGLNISYSIIQKHGGEIKVFSRPGRTRFQVFLPVDFQRITSESGFAGGWYHLSDENLLEILKGVKSISVVGISDKKDQPNHAVPAYLQSAGYRIIPVNPYLTEVLGEKAYPDLDKIPKPIDLVLVFRRNEVVPEIVDRAIRVGAKVIWMQEGVYHDQAAAKAREAGLEVVMDTCMRATHKRLIGHL